MKNTVLSLVLISSLILSLRGQAGPLSEKTKSAVEHLSGCGNFLRTDSQYVFTGFGAYWTSHDYNRAPRPALVKYVDIQTLKEDLFYTADSAIDLVSTNGATYVLTYSGIEEWDLKTKKRLGRYPTISTKEFFADEEHAQSMASYQDKVVIAHGRLGVVIFNLSQKKATTVIPLSPQGPLESMAKGVTVVGSLAYVVVDSYSLVGPGDKPAFRGIVVIDLTTEKIVKEFADLPPGLDSVSSDSRSLILSFYGNPLWKYSIAQLMKNKKTQPTQRVFKFPLPGAPTGKAFVDDMYYYSCFSQMPGPGQGSHFKRTQVVINRQQWLLD